MQWLNRAFDFKDEDLYAIRDDPLVSKLEGDPRYQAFLKKLNFQTKEQTPMNRDHGLLPLILIYGAASLVHFLHNAVYLGSYPNMPVWLTPLGVLASWLVVAATGAIGYWLLRRGSTAMGLAVTGLYAILGFDSLDHYAVAPVSAHSLAMNATIVIELITAAALLVATARVAFRRTATSSI